MAKTTTRSRKTRTPAQREAAAEARTERLADLHARLDAGVNELRDSGSWRRMLDGASLFHHYSFGNMMMIMSQCPDATWIAGFRRWQGLGRNVIKGEKAIYVLAPMLIKVDDKDNPGEKKQVRIYKPVPVFDVSQTEGAALPESLTPAILPGEAPEGAHAALVAWLRTAGWSVVRRQLGAFLPNGGIGLGGYTDHEAHRIVIERDTTAAEAFSTLVHEATHALLHEDSDDYRLHRGRCEVEAESVAYVVLGHLGVQSLPSLSYVTGWASVADRDVVQATGATVIATAHTLIEAIEGKSDDGEVSD